MQMELVFVCDKHADILNIKWTEQQQKLGFFLNICFIQIHQSQQSAILGGTDLRMRILNYQRSFYSSKYCSGICFTFNRIKASSNDLGSRRADIQ